MSAFIMEEKEFRKLERALQQISCRPEAEMYGLNNDNYDQIHRKIYDLYRCNVESVNYRYRDLEPYEAISLEEYERIEVEPKAYTLEAVFKQLQCVNYQSCELHDYEISTSARYIKSLKEKISLMIISESTEYKSATWGEL